MASLNFNFIIEDFETSDIWVQILTKFGAKLFPINHKNLWEIDFIVSNKNKTNFNLPILNINTIKPNLNCNNFIHYITDFYNKEKMKLIKKYSAENLSQTEFLIFQAIYKMDKYGISNSELLKIIGYNEIINSHTIQTHIHSIRKKLNINIGSQDGNYIFK